MIFISYKKRNKHPSRIEDNLNQVAKTGVMTQDQRKLAKEFSPSYKNALHPKINTLLETWEKYQYYYEISNILKKCSPSYQKNALHLKINTHLETWEKYQYNYEISNIPIKSISNT